MRGARGNARRSVLLASCAAASALPACGGQARQDADEPRGSFTVEVVRADFPRQQRLAKQARMTIAIRNAGAERVPNVSVTLRGGGGGTSSGSGAQGQGQDAFGYRTTQPGVSDPSRPIWILDRGPKQVLREGPGGGVTAYVNTWALGGLDRGKVKTFTWDVTAVRPGRYTIDWRVNAGLDGKAIAKLDNGRIPEGSFPVSISGEPSQSSVADDGSVVRSE